MMKKIFLLLMFVLSLTLIGCSEEDTRYQELEERIDTSEDRLADTQRALIDFYVITEDGKLYSNCRLDGMEKVCDEISVVTDEELQLNLQYWFKEYDKFDNYYTKEEIDNKISKANLCSILPALIELKPIVQEDMLLDDTYLTYISYIRIIESYCQEAQDE